MKSARVNEIDRTTDPTPHLSVARLGGDFEMLPAEVCQTQCHLMLLFIFN